jgi:putative transcriptional regulator
LKNRWIALVLGLSGWMFAGAPDGRAQSVAAGSVLVAEPDAPDPSFAETVILMVHYNSSGGMGLVLNRRTKFPVSRIISAVPGAEKRSDPVYVGGPVGRTGILGLVRKRVAPEGAERVLADVHLVSTKAQLEKILAEGAKPDSFRLYLGYSGWGAGQLEREMSLGLWRVIPGDAQIVFDPDPDTLWERLNARFKRLLAMGRGR